MKFQFRVKYKVIHILIFIVVVAIVLELEHLRRRRIIFQAWVREWSEQIPVLKERAKENRDQIHLLRELLKQETEMPNTTGRSIDELEKDLSDMMEIASEEAIALEDSQYFKKKCKRAAERPWEDPWPLRMPFWPSLQK
jgi:hypothetical protein